MRISSALSILSAAIWTLLLWSSVESALMLAAKDIPGFPNAMQIGVFIGLPVIMLVATLTASVTIRMVERRAAGFMSDNSHWLEPVPVFCLLMVLPYIVMMAL